MTYEKNELKEEENVFLFIQAIKLRKKGNLMSQSFQGARDGSWK